MLEMRFPPQDNNTQIKTVLLFIAPHIFNNYKTSATHFHSFFSCIWYKGDKTRQRLWQAGLRLDGKTSWMDHGSFTLLEILFTSKVLG
jgi:hypothetical protein